MVFVVAICPTLVLLAAFASIAVGAVVYSIRGTASNDWLAMLVMLWMPQAVLLIVLTPVTGLVTTGFTRRGRAKKAREEFM